MYDDGKEPHQSDLYEEQVEGERDWVRWPMSDQRTQEGRYVVIGQGPRQWGYGLPHPARMFLWQSYVGQPKHRWEFEPNKRRGSHPVSLERLVLALY